MAATKERGTAKAAVGGGERVARTYGTDGVDAGLVDALVGPAAEADGSAGVGKVPIVEGSARPEGGLLSVLAAAAAFAAS